MITSFNTCGACHPFNVCVGVLTRQCADEADLSLGLDSRHALKIVLIAAQCALARLRIGLGAGDPHHQHSWIWRPGGADDVREAQGAEPE